MASIKYDELEMALHFVSGGEILDASAHVSRETGRIVIRNSDSDSDFPPPSNVKDADSFAAVPHSRELGLGRNLALDFAAENLPNDHDRIAAIFRRPAAFASFKDLLETKGLIQAWYEFEQAATKRALVDWAEGEGFSVHE